MNRRGFLRWGTMGGSVVIGGGIVAAQFTSRQTIQGSKSLVSLTDSAHPLPQHWITPKESFYVQSYSGTPTFDPTKWSLELSGQVENPRRFSLADIQALPAEEFYWTLECIGNPGGGELIGNARWKGTRLLPLLEAARIRSTTQAFALHAADDYMTGIPLAELLQPDVWLAYEMNGEPLPKQHGYPLRIFIPGKYGQKQPKWLTQIEAVSDPVVGYWERRGWSNQAAILTQALPRQIQSQSPTQVVSQKASRVSLPAGRVVLAGVALASGKPIRQVRVSRDGGSTWQLAEQNQPHTPYEWTLWRHSWDLLQPGSYELMAQAIAEGDGSEMVQPLQDLESLDGNNAVLKIKLNLT